MALPDCQEPAVTSTSYGGLSPGVTLPPLHTQPGTSQKSPQPPMQPRPAGASGSNKLASAGDSGAAHGFAPGASRLARPGDGRGSSAANTISSRFLDASGIGTAGPGASGRAPGPQAAASSRLSGSAGSHRGNRVGGGHGRDGGNGGEPSGRSDTAPEDLSMRRPVQPPPPLQLQQQPQQPLGQQLSRLSQRQQHQPQRTYQQLQYNPQQIMQPQFGGVLGPSHGYSDQLDLAEQPQQQAQQLHQLRHGPEEDPPWHSLGQEGNEEAAEQGEQQEDEQQEQLAQLQGQEQQQQEEQQQGQRHSNNPFLHILRKAGVVGDIGGIGGGGGSLAAAAQAAHQVQQAALRKRVQRDIKRMLAHNRAYQHHVKGPPALSAESLAQLAQPKQRPGSGPDLQVVSNLPDPVEWARWKTDQLVISRLAEERRQTELAEEKRRAEEQLTVFRQQKMEVKQTQAEAKARQAADEAAYRANMSAYLNHKGQVDLEDFVKRKEEQRERLSLMRSRQVKSLSAHHY